jgi:hypothetical protein
MKSWGLSHRHRRPYQLLSRRNSPAQRHPEDRHREPEMDTRQHIGTLLQPSGPRKKLRESCNSCAVSKVKCSRDQPTCKRCEDRGIFCLFSPSRRSGKRRRVPLIEGCVTAESTSTSSSTSPHASNTIHSSPFVVQHTEPQCFDSDIMVWDYPFLDVDFDAIHFDKSMIYHSRIDEPIVNDARRKMGTTDEVSRSYSDAHARPTASPQTEAFSRQPAIDIKPQAPCQSSASGFQAQCSQDCMTIALNVSHVLHASDRTCIWVLQAPPDLTPNAVDVEQTLAANREAIDLVLEILRCPCSLERGLRLLLTLLCSRIITRCNMVLSEEARSNGGHQGPNRQTTTTEQQAVWVGRSRKTVQVVLSELYRLSELVGQLARRSKDSGEESRGWVEDMDLRRTAGIESLLRDELSSVTARTMEILLCG